MTDGLRQLFRRFREGMGELEEALLGDRLERALDQDIHTTDAALRDTRANATAMKAKRINMENRAQALRTQAKTAEDAITVLLARRRKTAAREQATALLEMRARLAELDTQLQQAARDEATLQDLADRLDQQLRRLRHQVAALRASASIRRAQEAIARREQGETAHPEPAQAARKRAEKAGRTTSSHARRNAAASHTSPSVEDPVDALLRSLTPSTPTTARKPK